ncbi:MAG: hypothetical protein DSZ23_06195, partial [Thermodesulfatator sp.]
LKRATQYVLEIVTGTLESQESVVLVISELEGLAKKHHFQEEQQEDEIVLLAEEQEKEDEAKTGQAAPAVEKEQKTGKTDTVQEAAPQPTSDSSEGSDFMEHGAMPKESRLDEQGRIILGRHLAELKRCVKRIQPLEELLSRTPGMEKLHRFQHDLRTDLEEQINQVSDYFFDGQVREVPEAPSSTKESPIDARHLQPSGCQWKELLTINVDGMEIGFPEDQVVYMSAPPWHAKSAIKKANNISLGKLKPWPWSKLKNCFLGRLAGLDDSTLSDMRFPVVRRLGETELQVPPSFVLILLYDGKRGAAILAEEKPIRIEIPGDASCEEKTGKGFEAEVNTHGNKIMIATADSLNQV